MDKISISDFCGEEKTYAQLIQDLYFHISVKLAGIIAERTGMTKKQVYQKTEKDSYLNAEESLKCGIATKIIE